MAMPGLKQGGDTAAQITTAVIAVAATAALTGLALPLFQSDRVSRIMLDANQLDTKRKAEYVHRWNQALSDVRGLLNISQKVTEIASSPEEIQTLVQECLKTPPQIVTISKDSQDASQEYFCFLQFPTSQGIHQVPLMKFGEELASAMEGQLTSTALCFVADASSGRGTKLLGTILEESKAGVSVLSDPFWMVLVASLAQTKFFSQEPLTRLVFGLCRLEAARISETKKTVCFLLPGQACTPLLLPLLQAAFPCERHVFVYDTCVNSVSRVARQSRHMKRGSLKSEEELGISVMRPLLATTPLTQSLTKTVRSLKSELAQLPLHLADTTETWMASVNAFLQMKQDEQTNEYLPYVLKLPYLTEGASLDDEGSTRRLALLNVLQFVTGSRSRPLPPGVFDAAVEVLRDFEREPLSKPLPAAQHKVIDDAVFCHKGILIQDKTLIDTVQPSKEWSLKAAKKISGCACCGPEDEDEEEKEDAASRKEPGAFAVGGSSSRNKAANKTRPAFVDGKTAFAFDPTAFS